MTTLTRAAVAEALDQAVQERSPDYVYPTNEVGGCFYSFEDGTPACIVGYVIAKLDPEAFQTLVDLERPEQRHHDDEPRRYAYGSVFSLVSTDIIEVENNGVLKALREAQAAQDTGSTWGDARHQAITAFRAYDADQTRFDGLMLDLAISG